MKTYRKRTHTSNLLLKKIVFISGISGTVLHSLGYTILSRIPKCTRRENAQPVLSSLSIIIPARNEYHRIGRLFSSLASQPFQPKEVIVVDDGSVDGTNKLALECGARVIESEPRPHGWTGKAWACMQGAYCAYGKQFLFLDADVWFETDGLVRIAGEWAHNRGILSIQPYHRMEKSYEQLSSFLNIIALAGMGAFALSPLRRHISGVFGPCLLCSRENYFSIGGHRIARNSVVEHRDMGYEFRKIGIPVYSYGGKNTLSFRMYPEGLRSLIEGWGKAIAWGANRTPSGIMICINFWISGAYLALISIVSFAIHCKSISLNNHFSRHRIGDVFAIYKHLIAKRCRMNKHHTTTVLLSHALSSAIRARIRYQLVPIGAYVSYVFQLFWVLNRFGNFSFLTAFFFPIHLLFFTIVFIYSLIRIRIFKSVKWKGRLVQV